MSVPADIDFDFWRLIWEIAVTVISLCACIAWLWLTRHFAHKKDVQDAHDGIEESLGVHNDRITVIEETLKHVPGRLDIQGLRTELSGVRSELAELRGEQLSQNQVLARIHEHLLNRSAP